MYTLVMMTALATAPEATQFNGFFRDLFGGGGCHSGSNSQSDSTNCRGSNCNGCGGGLFHGGIISFFSFGGGRGSGCHSSCQGNGSGSCNGRGASAGSACHGSGCTGTRHDPGYAASCFGASCMGGAFAPMMIPGTPGDYAQPIPTNSGYGCGGSSSPGGSPMILPGGNFSPVPFSPPTSVPSERDTYRPAAFDESSRGVILVRLPEDAKLFAEGRQLALKTESRRFVTPPLPADRDAVYNLRVEYTRDGEVISRTKRVQVRAGDTKTVEFGEQSVQNPLPNPPELFAEKPALGSPTAPPSSAPGLPMGTPTVNKSPPLPPLGGGTVTVIPPPQASSDRAKITVKLPLGATLYVDARRNDRPGPVREFTTPVLKKGELYTYTLRVEWRNDGRTESEERKVEFMAGELHTVDFTLPNHRAGK